MDKFLLAGALCVLAFPSFANIRPCEGAPGTYHTNPDSTSGGFVATTAVVDPLASLSPDSQVCDFSTLKGAVKLHDQAIVSGRAALSGNIAISGDAHVFGDANLINSEFGTDMVVSEEAQVYGNAYLYGNLVVNGTSEIFGNAHIYDFVQILGASKVCGNAILKEYVVLTDNISHCSAKK